MESRIAAHLPAGHGLAGGAHPAAGAIPALIRSAASKGFDDTFWIAAGVAALALPASLLLRRPLPEGERLLAEAEGAAPRHPALAPGVRAGFVLLLVASLAFLAFTVGKALESL